MKYINLFPTQASYDAADKYYPNVSYIEATDEVKYQETDPTAIVTKFVTTSANQSKTITVRNYLNLFSGITADGEPLTLSTSDYFFTHTFAEAGEHEVVYKFNNPTTIPDNGINFSDMISIIIPSSVTTITRFYSIKEGLTSIKVDSGNTVYDSRGNCNAIIETATNTLFRGCNNTVIPNTVTSIGGGALYNCTGLTSITIPDSVTSIGGSAFAYSRLSGTLTIPNSVTSIGDNAFANINNTSNTLSVILPNTITTIENSTFAHSTSLVSVTIPDTVTIIGNNAFYGTGLTSITIPDSVTSIGKSQFYECGSLTSVTLGSSVASIGESFFERCRSLTSVTSLNTTPPTYYSQYGNQLFYGVPATCAIYVPAASVDAYKAANGWSERAAYIQAIPAPVSTTITATFTTSSPNMSVYITNKQQLFSEITVEGSQQTIGTGRMNYTFATAGDHVVTYTAVDTTAIGMDAFDDCRGLTSIIIPNSVTSIEDEAFKDCYDLVSITLSDSLITIGEYTFSGTAITSLTIPEGVTTIGDDAFRECEYLDNITLPSTLTSIGSGAFSSCYAITSMTCYATTPPTAGEYALTDIASDSPVFVPAASVSAYQSASGWSRLYIEPIQD